MLKYLSTKGGGSAVDFETAILNGYASDGGLYVPEHLPAISKEKLASWKHKSYQGLAYEIASLFIDRSVIAAEELKQLIEKAYGGFEKNDVLPIHKLKSRENTYVMELFHGPTLSFKDVGLAFLVHLFHFFLDRKGDTRSVLVATTGDTGPAAASFVAGLATLDAWVLYPKGLITAEQERQMTTLPDNNVHPVGVYNCPDGGDDLDAMISTLYANTPFKEKHKLSSVNSLNWGRVMIQIVHYFYGYLQVVDFVGEEIHMAVPSGGFGNLCAGGLARKMGLPINTFVSANNTNACLHRIFSQGIFSREPIHETVSSAIDILIPINFWRYLYFCTGQKAGKIKGWMETFEETGTITFDKASFEAFKKGFLSESVSDPLTLTTMKDLYENENYLLDPHGAVSLAAVRSLDELPGNRKLICLATAHPAKFPEVVLRALETGVLPTAAIHPSIEAAKKLPQKGYIFDLAHLEEELIKAMESHWEQSKAHH